MHTDTDTHTHTHTHTHTFGCYTLGVIQAADNNLCFAALFSYSLKGVLDELRAHARARSSVGVSAVPVVDLPHGNGNDGHLLFNCQFHLLQGDDVVDLGVYAVGFFNPAPSSSSWWR